MENKLEKIREVFSVKEESGYTCLLVFDGNGNEQFRIHKNKAKTEFNVSDTELSVLNALLVESRTRTFQLRIFNDNFICFLSSGGILIGREHFNEEAGKCSGTNSQRHRPSGWSSSESGLFVVGRIGGYTVLLRGLGKSERSLLELFQCISRAMSS